MPCQPSIPLRPLVVIEKRVQEVHIQALNFPLAALPQELLTMVPRPVVAVLLLFPITDETEAARKQGENWSMAWVIKGALGWPPRCRSAPNCGMQAGGPVGGAESCSGGRAAARGDALPSLPQGPATLQPCASAGPHPSPTHPHHHHHHHHLALWLDPNLPLLQNSRRSRQGGRRSARLSIT